MALFTVTEKISKQFPEFSKLGIYGNLGYPEFPITDLQTIFNVDIKECGLKDDDFNEYYVDNKPITCIDKSAVYKVVRRLNNSLSQKFTRFLQFALKEFKEVRKSEMTRLQMDKCLMEYDEEAEIKNSIKLYIYVVPVPRNLRAEIDPYNHKEKPKFYEYRIFHISTVQLAPTLVNQYNITNTLTMNDISESLCHLQLKYNSRNYYYCTLGQLTAELHDIHLDAMDKMLLKK